MGSGVLGSDRALTEAVSPHLFWCTVSLCKLTCSPDFGVQGSDREVSGADLHHAAEERLQQWLGWAASRAAHQQGSLNGSQEEPVSLFLFLQCLSKELFAKQACLWY